MEMMYSPFTALKNLDKLAVIWLNGSLKSAPTSWIRVWNGAKLKYCTDGAANFLMSLCENKSIECPQLIAGDFDSILPKVRSYFEGRTKVVHIADQDSTDLTKTLQLICQDPLIGTGDKILLFGGFHGRFDHTLGAMNAIVLHQKASNLPVFAIDGENVVTVLREVISLVQRVVGLNAEDLTNAWNMEGLSLRNPGVVYSLLLNVKGRIFSDLLIYKIPAVDAIILEADAARMPELERNLKIYRLRKQVELEPMNESIYFSTQLPSQESITNAFEDPRVPSFGYRIIGGELHFDDSFSLNDYTRRRLEWGIGEGYDELGDQIPLNVNGDIMNGIDFEKGCYIGQEMVARTHWTGVVRRRLLPFHCLDPAKTVEGINILDESKKRQGKILKSHGSVGISLVSISFAGRKLFDEAGNEILVYKPDWWPNDLK